MAHYTFQSGVRGETISSVCPVCLTRREWTKKWKKSAQLTLSQLCCSKECAEVWSSRLKELYISALESDPDIRTKEDRMIAYEDYASYMSRCPIFTGVMEWYTSTHIT